MSFIKKIASQHSGTRMSAGDGLLASEIKTTENFEATYDISDEGEAERLAAAAKAAAQQSAADAARMDGDVDDAVDDSVASGASSSAAALAVQKQPFATLDGANPLVTWPGEKTVGLMDGLVQYTERAQERERFVLTPPVFSRFDEVAKLGIAPSVYAIDLLDDDEDDERARLIAEMNQGMEPEAILTTMYDADKIAHGAPRFWCKWPGAKPVVPQNAQMTRTLVSFQLPLADSATLLDWHSLLAKLPPAEQKALPLALAPGSIEAAGMTRLPASVPFTDRVYHSIPVAIRIASVRNTSDVNFQVDLRVPNMKGGDAFVSQSDPIGVRSGGRLFASSADPTLNRVYMMHPGNFNSPEARRWSTVDRDAELAKFNIAKLDADLDDNQKALALIKIDAELAKFKAAGHGNKIVFVPATNSFLAYVLITDKPRNLLQYIAVTYPSQLYAAAANGGFNAPVLNLHIQKRNPVECPYGHISIRVEVLAAVINYYCDLYCPSKYAVNQHKWQLNATATNQASGMHALRALGERAAAQCNVKPAQLEYVLELIQLPYDGPQRCTDAQRALLKRIDTEHEATAKIARGVCAPAAKSKAPKCEPCEPCDPESRAFVAAVTGKQQRDIYHIAAAAGVNGVAKVVASNPSQVKQVIKW